VSVRGGPCHLEPDRLRSLAEWVGGYREPGSAGHREVPVLAVPPARVIAAGVLA